MQTCFEKSQFEMASLLEGGQREGPPAFSFVEKYSDLLNWMEGVERIEDVVRGIFPQTVGDPDQESVLHCTESASSFLKTLKEFSTAALQSWEVTLSCYEMELIFCVR